MSYKQVEDVGSPVQHWDPRTQHWDPRTQHWLCLCTALLMDLCMY